MTSQIDDKLGNFNRRRVRLNERLDESRTQIDGWFAKQDTSSSLGDVALLEGLLEVRRALLAELLQLDDEIISYLLRARAEGKGSRKGA